MRFEGFPPFYEREDGKKLRVIYSDMSSHIDNSMTVLSESAPSKLATMFIAAVEVCFLQENWRKVPCSSFQLQEIG